MWGKQNDIYLRNALNGKQQCNIPVHHVSVCIGYKLDIPFHYHKLRNLMLTVPLSGRDDAIFGSTGPLS